MIAWLAGRLMDASCPGKLVLDVNGVGYDVETSLQTFFEVNTQTDAVGLHIHTVVREDAFLLYGFSEKRERSLFRELIKVNGVGPKLAMGILSSIRPDAFIQCIHQKNTTQLTRLPGIGKKTAERLIIEMKDKLSDPISEGLPAVPQPPLASAQEEASRALEALGYKPQEVARVMDKLHEGDKTCEQLIREGLRWLSSLSAP